MEYKSQIFEQTKTLLNELQLDIVEQDDTRPWGGFFVINESQAKSFIDHFFPEENVESLMIAGKLSPKILLVEPGKRLSWQYHNRRAEVWRCIGGRASIITSFTNEESEKINLQPGDKIKLQQGERHRLVGLDEWGLIAEIWQHTDIANHRMKMTL